MQTRAAIRYAIAILDIAKEENSIDGVFSDMHIINSLNNSSSEFKNLLSNSQINNGDKKKAILSLIENPSSLTIKLLDLLIFNKRLSVCPITTHLPLKLVSKKISKENIIKKVSLINNFYEKRFKFKPRIAILGLNPHCESIHDYNEDEKIVSQAIKSSKKKFNVKGPFPADTLYLRDNIKNFNVILGMYHDQVLTPAKTLFGYDAINITMGLPFLRVSPDHGPNEKMVGKNISNPISLIR